MTHGPCDMGHVTWHRTRHQKLSSPRFVNFNLTALINAIGRFEPCLGGVIVANGVPQTGRRNRRQEMKIGDEGSPHCRLMFGHGRNDWNVNAGVSRVPEGIEPSRPRRHESHHGQEDDGGEDATRRQYCQHVKEPTEFLFAQTRTQIIQESITLKFHIRTVN